MAEPQQQNSHQSKLAFSYSLVGIKAPDKPDHQLLRVEKFSSTAYSGERIAERALTVTPEETKTNVDNVTCTGLWVGVRPHRAAVLRQQKAASVGDDPVTQAALDVLKKIDMPFKASVNSVVALDVLPVWPHEEFMTKVVVKFSSLQAGKILYYQLVNRNPQSQLCQAIPVTAEEVFFFQPYRDDDQGQIGKRIKEWPNEIKNYLAETLQASMDQGGFRPAKSTARVQFPPEISQALDIQSMSSQYAVTGASWLLDEMERALLKSEEDFKDADIPQLIAMYRLMNLHHKFEKEDAKEAHRWLTDMFPGLVKTGTLTPENVSKYANYLRDTETRVTYGDIRTGLGAYLFLQYIIQHSKTLDTTTNSAISKEIALMRPFFHEEAQGPPPKCTKVDTNLELWLSDHIRLLQRIVDAHNDSLTGIVDYHGTAASPDNLDDLWEAAGNSPDTDGAKFFALQASRYFAKEVIAKYNVTTKNLEIYISMCKKAVKDLKAAAGDGPVDEEDTDAEMQDD